MKITLNIDGNKKEFYSKGLTARASLKAFEYLEDIDKRVLSDKDLYNEQHIELLLDFIVSLYGGQFSQAEFLDGYEGSFFTDVPEMLRSVVSGFNAKVSEFPNLATPKEK